MNLRVLVAEFGHESNSFSPGTLSAEGCLTRGDCLIIVDTGDIHIGGRGSAEILISSLVTHTVSPGAADTFDATTSQFGNLPWKNGAWSEAPMMQRGR